MSSFWGYLLEGAGLTILWLWWTLNTFVQVIKCQSLGKEFSPRLSYPWPGTNVPVEILYKLAMSSLGFLSTLLVNGVPRVGDDGNAMDDNMATLIYMSIYGIFLVHSLVELMMWFGAPLVRDADYVTAALGFLWYSLATFYRAGDFMTKHWSVAAMVKTFPLYPLATIGVSLLVETGSRRGYWTQMMRLICLGVAATWDWNAAFILHAHGSKFPGKETSDWDMSDHSNTAFIGAAFGDHVCLHIVFLIVVYGCTAVYLRLRHGLKLHTEH